MLFGSLLSSRVRAGQVSLASLTQPAVAWTRALSGRPMACCLQNQVLVLACVCVRGGVCVPHILGHAYHILA